MTAQEQSEDAKSDKAKLYGETTRQNKKDTTLEEIVVTATRTPMSLGDAPADVSVVTQKDIESRNIQTIDEAMDILPGVYDKRAKPLDTTAAVTLRGIPDQKRTLVLLDGLPLNDGYTGAVNWNGIFPQNIERIEVARGPFSSLYGGNAMGGVINILTRMPEKREVTFQGGYGSDNYWTSYGSYGDKFFNRLSVFASYGYGQSDGYPTALNVKTPTTSGSGTQVSGAQPTTTAQGVPAYLIGDMGDNSWWRNSATFKAAYDLTENTKASFSFMRNSYGYGYDDPGTYLRDSSGSPVWSGPVVFNDQGPRRLSFSESSFLSGDGEKTENIFNAVLDTTLFDSVAVKATCGLVDQPSYWYITPSSTAVRSGGPGTINETPSQSFQSNLQVSVPILEKHLLTVGTSYQFANADTQEHALSEWTDSRSKGDLTYESKGEDGIFSLYAQAEIALWKNLTAYLGIRGDYWETFDGMVNQVGTAGFPQTFDTRNSLAVSPKASLVYKLFDTTTIRASAGRSFRPPNVYELYRTWVYYGVTYASNPNLDPEYCLSWDVGIEQKLGENGTLTFTYFNNSLKDLIYLETVTSTYQQYINAGRAETKGFEVEMKQKLCDWMKVFGGFTFTESEMLENPAKPSTEGMQLTGVPERMFNLGGEFTHGPFLMTLVGRFADKVYGNDQNLDTASNVYGSYDSYFLADLFMKYQVTKCTAITFAVDNLFDSKYYTYYRAPGRQLFAGLTVKF